MQRTRFDSMPCPLARAMDHLSDSWNVLILRDAFYGLRRFDEFESALGIASNTLTRRLKELVAGGLLERRRYADKPPRHEYVLTAKGRDLRPVLLTLLAWGNKYSHPPGSAVRLVDTSTGEPVELALVDANSGKPIGPEHQVLRRAPDGQARDSIAFSAAVKHL